MARKRIREVDISIESLSVEGLGTGRAEDRPVHARNALPGERVHGRVLKRRRGIWYAQAETPDVRAPQRQNPPCPFFPRCGGCALQHLAYEAQLAHKEQTLLRMLDSVGVQPRIVRPPSIGPQLHYRYKARLGVRVVGGALLAGFREGFSNRVARMDHCATLALPFARSLASLQRTLAGLEAPDQIPQVELAAGDAQFAYIVRHLQPLSASDEARLLDFGQAHQGIVYLQPGGYDSVRALDPARASGLLSYTNPDFGLLFRFRPTDFTQVNPFVNRLLVRSAVLAADPAPGTRVADLFCGIGNFALALARRGASVRGYESAPGAIDRARGNAALNGLEHGAEFAVADLYDAPGADLPEAEVLLLDPPRSGAGPNLQRWAQWRSLRKVVYVSCNPATFAEDARVLEQMGFVLEEAGIFDMFPHTAHVETLGVFQRHG